MLIRAQSNYIKISPRKLGLLALAIKNLTPTEAVDNLRFINKRSAKPLIKVIKSAIANAVNNYKIKDEDLVFKEIRVEKGPTLKRWQAVSRGRAHSIMKRTSHIKIILKIKNKKSKINVRDSKEKGRESGTKS